MLAEGAAVAAVTWAALLPLPLLTATRLLLLPGHHVVVPVTVSVVTHPTEQPVTYGGHSVTEYTLVEKKVEVSVAGAVAEPDDVARDLLLIVWLLPTVCEAVP